MRPCSTWRRWTKTTPRTLVHLIYGLSLRVQRVDRDTDVRSELQAGGRRKCSRRHFLAAVGPHLEHFQASALHGDLHALIANGANLADLSGDVAEAARDMFSSIEQADTTAADGRPRAGGR